MEQPKSSKTVPGEPVKLSITSFAHAIYLDQIVSSSGLDQLSCRNTVVGISADGHLVIENLLHSTTDRGAPLLHKHMLSFPRILVFEII